MIKTNRALLAGAMAAALLAGSARALDYKVPVERVKPIDPKLEPVIKNRFQLPPEVVRQALDAARITSASLSVYAVPFDRWCATNPNRTTEGRVSARVRFNREADGTTVPANLVVNTGTADVRKRIALGAGEFSVASDVLSFQGTAICTDRCVTVRLEAIDPADAGRINTSTRQACLP